MSFKRRAYREIWKIDQKKLIKDLIDICKAIDIRNPKCFDNNDFSRNSYIQKTISGISFHILKEGDNVLWWCSHLQSGPVADPVQVIPKIVNKKIQSGENYDWQDADSHWLIITALSLGLSDTGVILRNEKQLKLKRQDVFDYIYYWDKFSEEIWEIYPNFRIILDVGNKAIYVSRLPKHLPNYRTK